jgi:hypothetical protein
MVAQGPRPKAKAQQPTTNKRQARGALARRTHGHGQVARPLACARMELRAGLCGECHCALSS